MLRVTLIGNIGADPEKRYTAQGVPTLQFRVAVNQRLRDRDGEAVEDARWFRCRLTGKRAEAIESYLSKGTRVTVVGRLEISDYTTKDGDPRTGFDVWVDDIDFSRAEGGNGRRSSDDEQPASRAPAAAPARRSAAPAAADPDLEDLPF